MISVLGMTSEMSRKDTSGNKMVKRYYYTMGQVCKMVNLEPSVLRFWQKEFRTLNPHRRDKLSNRRYTLHDIEIIKQIKFLLYDQKYTIKGARKQLRLSKEKARKRKIIREIKRRVNIVKNLLVATV